MKVVTATNEDDIFIMKEVAVLEYSRVEAEHFGIPVLFDLGRFGWGGSLMSGHEQILRTRDPWSSWRSILLLE